MLISIMGCDDGAKSTRTDEPNSAAPTAQSISLSTDSSGLVQQQTARGEMVKLDGRHQAAVMARRNADGSITTECHDEQAEADAFLAGTSKRTTQLETK